MAEDTYLLAPGRSHSTALALSPQLFPSLSFSSWSDWRRKEEREAGSECYIKDRFVKPLWPSPIFSSQGISPHEPLPGCSNFPTFPHQLLSFPFYSGGFMFPSLWCLLGRQDICSSHPSPLLGSGFRSGWFSRTLAICLCFSLAPRILPGSAPDVVSKALRKWPSFCPYSLWPWRRGSSSTLSVPKWVQLASGWNLLISDGTLRPHLFLYLSFSGGRGRSSHSISNLALGLLLGFGSVTLFIMFLYFLHILSSSPFFSDWNLSDSLVPESNATCQGVLTVTLNTVPKHASLLFLVRHGPVGCSQSHTLKRSPN